MNKIAILVSFLFAISYTVNAQSDNKTTDSRVIKGTIKDETGKAVPFASINIKDENGGTSTDSLGRFTLNAKLNSVLVIGSVGFETTEVNISNKAVIIVLLKRTQQSLKDVSVAAKNNNNINAQSQAVLQQQTISNTFSEYTMGSNITNSPSVFYKLQNGNNGVPAITSNFGYNAGSGKVYQGSGLVVFMPKDETKGRQYLFEKWVPGIVINEKGEQVKNDLFLYNYDKMGKVLLFTQDQVNIIELDMNTINAFSLLYTNEPTIFLKINVSGKSDFYQLLTSPESKYELYKTTNTKLVKANYVSTGLTSTGNNYDEFLDDNRYFIYSEKEKNFVAIELKKKSIKAVLENEKPKVDEWFSQNGNADMDEAFLKGLITFLNKE